MILLALVCAFVSDPISLVPPLFHRALVEVVRVCAVFIIKENNPMLRNTKPFSSFSVDDLRKAKDFYRKTLGLEVQEEEPAGSGTYKKRNG
jgi:hypothetical protein